MVHQSSCPDTPQQNGVAEPKNWHLIEVARALLFEMHVPKSFKANTVLTCYLINRMPSSFLNRNLPHLVLFLSQLLFYHQKYLDVSVLFEITVHMCLNWIPKFWSVCSLDILRLKKDIDVTLLNSSGILLVLMSFSLRPRPFTFSLNHVQIWMKTSLLMSYHMFLLPCLYLNVPKTFGMYILVDLKQI